MNVLEITNKALRDAIHFAKSMIGSGWPRKYANQRAAEYYGFLTEEITKYTKLNSWDFDNCRLLNMSTVFSNMALRN